jgi:hypothetical protein
VRLARDSGATILVLDADRHAIPFYQHMGAELVDDVALSDASGLSMTSTPRMRYVVADSLTEREP